MTLLKCFMKSFLEFLNENVNEANAFGSEFEQSIANNIQFWIEANGLIPSEVAFVGDDIPDYESMNYVGLSIAPSDAAVDILQIATYISPAKGGEGVARDFLEQLTRNNGQWLNAEKAFGW